DAEGKLSATTTATETITVNPPAPSLAPVTETGLEGATRPLDLRAGVNGLVGDANRLAALVVSAIPVGATLSDGSHSFTATAGHTSVDVHGWHLAGLAITPTRDANLSPCTTLSRSDAEGKLSATTTATETITVNPPAPSLAPVTET